MYILDDFNLRYMISNKTEEQRLTEIGQELAARCDWSREDIISAAFHALCDANYSEDALKLVDALDAYDL